MQKLIIAVGLSFISVAANAQSDIQIKIGKDYRQYSHDELRRRVWELERTVNLLSDRLYALELRMPPANPTQVITVPTQPPTKPKKEEWICSTTAMGETYSATGESMAAAKHKAMEACKSAQDGRSFHCSEPKCEK